MKLWSKIPFIIISLVLALFPFLIVSFSRDFSEWNIGFLIFSGVVILIFYEAINLGKLKRIAFLLTPFNQGIILFVFSFFISSIFAPNFISSLLSPLGLGIVIVLSIWYVLLSNILNLNQFKILFKIFLATSVIFSIFIILENLSIFKLFNFTSFWLVRNQIPESPAVGGFPGMTNWSESLSFLLPILIILGYYLYGLFKNMGYIPHHSRFPHCHSRVNGNLYLYNNYNMNPPVKLEDDRLREIVLVVSFFLLLTASLLLIPWPTSLSSPSSSTSTSSTLSTSSTFPTFPLPFSSGWSISLDTLKQPKNAILGYGVENFPVAFNLNRPLGLNSFFTRSSNTFLQLLTENGLFGLLAFFYLLFLAFKETKTRLSLQWNPFSWSLRGASGTSDVAISTQNDEIASLPSVARNDTIKFAFLGFWSTVLLMFFLPPNLILLFYFFTFLALINVTSPLPLLPGEGAKKISSPLGEGQDEVKIKTYDLSNLENTIWIVSITLISLTSLTIYMASQAYLAELNYQKALSAIAKNAKIGPVYNLLKSATDQNPNLPRYHITLSQTMLFWGTSLTKKDNVMQQDRQDATTLIQQAIAHAQQAISQNPQDSSAWQNLGEIYRTIISSVNGADSWAATALTQAVSLNPNFSQTHFALAGLYIQLSQWENAKRQLEIAVALDPGFGNGFYNLYYVQKQQGLYQDALESLNHALALFPANSSQTMQLQSEKTALGKLIPQAASPSSPSSTFTTPSTFSTSSSPLSPKLNLPQTASPPAHFKPSY